MIRALAMLCTILWIAPAAEASFRLERTTGPAIPALPAVPALPALDAAVRPVRIAVRQPVAAPVAPTRLPELTSGRCGGSLPPCSVMRKESGPSGDIHAYNPTGCSGRGCYGKWQCDPATCDGTGTEAEQDAEARRVWAGGRGCSHWDACG